MPVLKRRFRSLTGRVQCCADSVKSLPHLTIEAVSTTPGAGPSGSGSSSPMTMLTCVTIFGAS
jgi:hypothetical protein